MKAASPTDRELAEQLQLLYSNSVVPVTVSMFLAAIIVWFQWAPAQASILLNWLTLVMGVSVVRLVIFYRYGRSCPLETGLAKWHALFLLGTYISGMTWGVGAFVIFPENAPVQQMVFTFIIAGLAAGAISSLCPSWPAISGFLVLLLVPMTVRFVTLEQQHMPLLGFMVLLFLVTTLMGSRRVHDNIRENIRLRLQGDERERVLKASEERYRHIFNGAPLGIFHYNTDGVIVDCNDAFPTILGSSREVLVGLPMFTMLKDQQMIGAIRRSLEKGEGYYEGEYASVTAVKTTPMRVFMRSIRSIDNSIVGGVGIVEDFTERKLTEEQVRYYASNDALTGLPNRRSLLETMGRELSRAKRHGRNGALLFIDLDNFKNINESLGHSAGDEILQMAADRIIHSLRKEDTAARMGGDEFVILLPDLDDRMEVAAKASQVVAEKLSATLAIPFQLHGQELHVTSSIGISMFPTVGNGVDDILKQADTAMNRAKAGGRNSIRFFLPDMQQAADKRLRLNTELRTALTNREMSLFFQPQANFDGSIVGAEVLLRWIHPQRGVIPPGDFIMIAEETGIIKDIGQWVLTEACGKIREWSDSGLLSLDQTIAVNISPREFTADDFVDQVLSILRQTGANPHQLDIELTEGSLISSVDSTIEKINALRHLGIKFSVDDFGTGYSSLSYLKKLPLNTLKIDRSFIKDITADPNDAAIVETIIMMAENLEMSVIAEGVETRQQLDYLGSKGCDIYQGYFLSEPVPPEQFVDLLQDRAGEVKKRQIPALEA